MGKKGGKKRKYLKVNLGSGVYGEIYGYPRYGKTTRERLGDEKGCIPNSYRMHKVKKGVYVLVCITKEKGKRGGRTKALALIRQDWRLQRYKRHYLKEEKELLEAFKKKLKLREKLFKASKGNKKS